MTATDAEEAIKQIEKDKKAVNTYALVVNSKDESSAEYCSAVELNDYLHTMTGKTYEIITPDEAEYGYYNKCHYIIIGSNSLLFQSPYANYVNSMELSDEAYFVKSDENIVVIGGGSDRGVVYGVYEFLRSVGCEFYTADCEEIPTGISSNFKDVNIEGEPSISARHYLSYKTCYSSVDTTFTAKIGADTSYANLTSVEGGNVSFGYLGADTHNARYYVSESYWGTEYCPANTLATGGYVPCLTNGIEYNTDTTSTLSLVTENMKNLIVGSPSIKYFTFEQEDGHDGAYCTCSYCFAAAEKYGRSGVLVRFCNALINNLRADSELSSREFKIVTFAYEYTMTAPKGNVIVNNDLCIWYAAYSDMRYSLFADNQRAD